MAMKPISLSFKNTDEDKELYEWILRHSNLSGFIKDILRASMETNVSNKSQEPSKTSLIDMDF